MFFIEWASCPKPLPSVTGAQGAHAQARAASLAGEPLGLSLIQQRKHTTTHTNSDKAETLYLQGIPEFEVLEMHSGRLIPNLDKLVSLWGGLSCQ